MIPHHDQLLRGTCAAALVIVAGTCPAHSQETVALTPILVQGTDLDTDPTTETVTVEDLKRVQASTISDIFRNVPEVSVSGGSQAAAQKVYVRGLEATNLNVTIDGARQGRGFSRHHGHLNIDPDLLKQVEVEAGTGNALSGPGALGGAIRFRTKDAADLLVAGETFGAMVKTGFHTNDNMVMVGSALYAKPLDAVDILLYGVRSWSDDYEASGGTVIPQSASEPMSGLAKLTLRPAEDHTLLLSANYRENNGSRPRRPIFVMDPPDTAKDQDFERRTYALEYTYTPEDNPYVDLRFQASHNDAMMALSDIATGVFESESQWVTYGGDLRNRTDLGALRLTYGVDYNWDKSEGRDDSGTTFSETANTFGLYMQGDYRFDEAWLLSAGARFDLAHLDDLNGNTHRNNHISPNVSIRYRPISSLTLFAGWSQAFQGPRPINGKTLVNGSVADADTHVAGEVADTFELGAEAFWNGWSGDLTLFHTKVNNRIVYDGKQSTPFNRRNEDDLTLRGVTAAAGYRETLWDARLSYTHVDMDLGGRPISTGDFTYGSPKGDRLSLTLNYRVPSWDLSLGWNSTWVQDVTDVPTDYPVLPGYHVHDVSVMWRPAKRYELSLSVHNIFDERYMDQSTPAWISGGGGQDTELYEMGRDIRLTAMVKF